MECSRTFRNDLCELLGRASRQQKSYIIISPSQIPNIYVSNYSCPCLSSITLPLSLLLAQRQRVACLCIACTCEPTRCSTVQNILGTVDSLILIQCIVSWGRHLTGLQNSLCSMILCDKKNKESCNRWYDLSLSETVCDHTKRQTKSTINSKVLETTHLPCTSKTVRMCTGSQQNCTLETLFGVIKTKLLHSALNHSFVSLSLFLFHAFFMTWCAFLLEEDGYTVAIKGWIWSEAILRWRWGS